MPTPFADDKMILAVTDADGNYSMDNVPEDPLLTFKMPGYKLTKVHGRAQCQDPGSGARSGSWSRRST